MVPAPWIRRTQPMSDWWFPLLICGMVAAAVSAAALLMR
jgi:hypothetical protein